MMIYIWYDEFFALDTEAVVGSFISDTYVMYMEPFFKSRSLWQQIVLDGEESAKVRMGHGEKLRKEDCKKSDKSAPRYNNYYDRDGEFGYGYTPEEKS